MSIPLTTAPTLTQNSWTRVLYSRPHRKSLYLDNRSASDIYLYFGENPWAVNFDGTNDSVAANGLVGNAALMNTYTGSVTVRARVTNNAGLKTLFSISDTDADEYLALYFDASEKLTASLRTAAEVKWTLGCNAAVTADKWYTLKLLHNGSIPILYVDGERVEQWFSVTTDKTAWVPDLSGIDKARIGSNYFSSSEQNFFYGVMSDVKVQAGIATNGTGGTLVAHWALDEGTGTSLTDSAGVGGYTGTMSGATWANKDAALMRIVTGYNWDAPNTCPVQGMWAYTTGSGVVLAATEGI